MMVLLLKNVYEGFSATAKQCAGLVDDYIVFNSNQIKSVNNKGTFNESDSNIYYQTDVKSNKDHFVRHNITKSKIESALKLGGLSQPSLSIALQDVDMSNYGEIVLYFSPNIFKR